MSETELLLCPFCGGHAAICEGGARFFVTCMARDCYAALGEGYDAYAMPDHHFADEAEAIAAWNTRTQAAEIDRLREALKAAHLALSEAEAILGGEYGDTYGVLAEEMADLRSKIAALKEP